MIKHIYIENYTLIEHLSIDIDEGFMVITGETGAGKSMFIGALSFLMGNRTDTNVLKNKEKKTIVEVTFDLSNYNLQSIFEDLDLDYDNQCIVRREITPLGKSRAFINDTPVSATILKQITSQLIDIHTQNSNILLQNDDFQLLIIDQYAQLETELANYKKEYQEYQDLRTRYQYLKTLNKSDDKSYIEFLIKELEDANLQTGEQSQLEEFLRTLQHSQEIQSSINETISIIQEAEFNIEDAFCIVQQKLAQIAQYNEKYQNIATRIDSQLIEIQDIAYELRHLVDGINNQPNEIDNINERLNVLYRLQKKHNVNSENELLTLLEQLTEQMNRILDGEYEEVQLQQSIAKKEQQLQTFAEHLSTKRKNVLQDIEQSLKAQLQLMNMPEAEVKIEMQRLPDLTRTGYDNPIFLFNVNKGMALQPIAKIASGGEMSRLMLAIKSLIIKKNVLPTIVFDEIDTGVSGEISSKMGDVMLKIANYCQVISITHLPQVAAKAQHHYLIFKQSEANKTTTHIKYLDRQERIYELAKMISNEKVTDISLQAAATLLCN